MKHLLLAVLLVICSSCAPKHYLNPSFEKKTENHQVIAVLPYKITNSGKAPKNLNSEQLEEIQIQESLSFQRSLYHQILKSSQRVKGEIRVEFQSPESTNAILLENNIGIKESWTKRPNEMAQILGVDAVVVAHVRKTRYMSDLASYSVNVGTSVLRSVSEVAPFVPSRLDRTHDITLNCDLIDATDGNTLFNMACDVDVDWSRSSQETIDQVNRNISKCFPYRVNGNN